MVKEKEIQQLIQFFQKNSQILHINNSRRDWKQKYSEMKVII